MPDYPWRSRTREFQNFLYAQPKDVQREIKAAERDFLARRAEFSSPRNRAVVDFTSCMVGVREEVDTE
jgi:hypothetical protein